MLELLRMPEVSANATKAVLVGWEVREEEAFSAADTLLTVESEKAVVDVEAEAGGVVLKRLVPDGAEVEVGGPIALLGQPGETVEDVNQALAELGVSGDGQVTPGVAAAQQATDRDAEPAAPVADPPTGEDTGGRVFSSPLARRLAREAGLRLEEIAGTGPNGRIRRRDVEAATACLTPSPTTADTETGPPITPPATTVTTSPATTPSPSGAYQDVAHSKVRKAVASRLTESKQTTPHFYLRDTARVDELLAVRAQLNELAPAKVSVNDLVIKAAAHAHVRTPAMNVIWTPEAVRSFCGVDVSIAVATDSGLMAPVLRGVEKMPVSTVSTETGDLVERAKTQRLQQADLEGGTMTVSNLGMLGVKEFAAVIIPPQSAILAVGATGQEPVVEDGSLTVGTVMHVTLAVDHRAIDGIIAAQWMKAFRSLLEHPLGILA